MAAATTDLVSRGVPIRLYLEGDPRTHSFGGNPVEYAAAHRQEILAELAGMVERWIEGGRRLAPEKHRCRYWSQVIGGILDVTGLGQDFLANVAEATAQMDQGLLDLATLAEYVVSRQLGELYLAAGDDSAGKGQTPSLWVSIATDAQILRDKLADANPRAKATVIGIFFAGKLDRSVHIETADGLRTATLRRRPIAGGRQHSYYFEISDQPSDGVEADGAVVSGPEFEPNDVNEAGPPWNEASFTEAAADPVSDGGQPDGPDLQWT